MPKTKFTVEQTTDSVTIDEVIEGEYDEASIVFDDPPAFSITVPNSSGVNAHILDVGKEVTIKRAGQERFVGIIETPEPSISQRGSLLKVSGVHKGYKLLQAKLCDSYDFDEDGDPATTRDGVTVNPWEYVVFRKAGGTLDDYGNTPPVDGVRPDEIMQCLIGTKFVYQQDFQDNTGLLASGIYATTNAVQVYRDGETGDLRPKLQRVRDGANFKNGGLVESIPLENGDPNIDVMGDIASVDVIIIGELDGTSHPTLRVCRNARDTRTYNSVTLTPSANYLGSGLDAWTGTLTFADAPANKNSLGYELTIPGTGGTTTTKVHYIKLTATTASDVGLTEGTIDTYVSPTLDGIDANETDWLETDLQSFNRMEAIERVRTLTESDAANNSSPHWDAYVDSSLAFHFVERRGSDITTRTYSFGQENLKEISHEFYGKELAYQTIAYGAGSGIAQTRIVSKAEFSAGGLYDSDRDPSGVSPLYGSLPRVMRFIDANENSAVALLRKARAFHKLHRAPIESVKVSIFAEHIPYFNVGDAITVSDIKTRTDGLFRVVELKRSWSGSRAEEITVRLGEPVDDFASRLAETRSSTEVITVRPQPSGATSGLSGSGTYFDKDHFGVYSFGVSDGASIDRVLLKMTTLPWQATARAGDASGVTSDSATHSHPGEAATAASHSHPGESATAASHSHPGQTAGAIADFSMVSLGSANSDVTITTTKANTDLTLPTSMTITSGGSFVNDGMVLQVQITPENDDDFRLEIDLLGTGGDTTSVPFHEWWLVSVDNTVGGAANNVTTMHYYIPAAVLRFFSMTTVTTVRIRHSKPGANCDANLLVRAYRLTAHTHPVSIGTGGSHSHTVNIGTGGSHGHTVNIGNGGSHSHTFTSAPIPLTFGIYQFDGDSGDGSGDPIYGTSIAFAVDPTISPTTGLPTTFATEKHPQAFGKQSGPQTVEYDVTGYMEVDANGIIKNGEHRVFLQGAADTNNANGLSVVSITPIVKFKESG